MENVLLDQSSRNFEFPKRAVGGGRCRPRPGARLATPHSPHGSFPTMCQQYHQLHKGGAWNSTPALPYARPPIYSSPSLPLLPSNQPPLLPLPPTATKYATFPYPPPPQPRTGRAAATTAVQAAAPPSRQRDRRRRPARPTPTEPARAQKKKPLERAAPLPPAPVVAEALDDLEQEVARSFVQDLLHALAPPPSSLPLPRFSLVVKASSSSATAAKVAPAAPSCNQEAAAADDLGLLLRL